jgi:transcriptional regulator of heat shock response
MSLVDEVKAKEEVWDSRDDIDELMDEVTHALAARTKSLSVAALKDNTTSGGNKNRFWQAGQSYIFNNPEFAEMSACQNLFSIFEEFDKMDRLFFGMAGSTSPLEVLFGEEIGWPELMPVGIVSTHFSVKGKPCALGIIGPARSNYGTVIPILRYYGNLIQGIANG